MGAAYEDTNGTDAGAIYVFRHNGSTWIEEAKLIPDSTHANQQFGWDVALDGGLAVISAHLDDSTPGGVNAGAVYVFRFDGTNWVQETKLFAAYGATEDKFGYRVDVQQDAIAVGAYHKNHDGASDTGAAYLFTYNGATWSEQSQIINPTRSASDRFGSGVKIQGDVLLVSADHGDVSGQAEAGWLNVFDMSED